MLYKKYLTNEQAIQKLKHYCAYQERCHGEVRDKLYRLGIWKKVHDEIIAVLIEENYLDEERFAITFTGGKFRINQWGRIKIKQALKQKQVSSYSIKKALEGIDMNDYRKAAVKLAAKKYASLKNENDFLRKKKTMDYLLARGYEAELARDVIERNE